jgi:hypothetical protein
VSAGPEPPLSCDLRLNHASNLTPDNAPRFLSLLAQAAVLASIPGPACHLETFGQPNGGGLETLVELEFSLAGVDGSLNSTFLYHAPVQYR